MSKLEVGLTSLGVTIILGIIVLLGHVGKTFEIKAENTKQEVISCIKSGYTITLNGDKLESIDEDTLDKLYTYEVFFLMMFVSKY